MMGIDGHIKITDFGMCKDGMKPGHKTSTYKFFFFFFFLFFFEK